VDCVANFAALLFFRRMKMKKVIVVLMFLCMGVLVGCDEVESIDGYTVTFVTNSEESMDSITVKIGQRITTPSELEKEGHSFLGWYTDEELTDLYDFDEAVPSDVTLYASWEANEYTITFSFGYQQPVEYTYSYGEEIDPSIVPDVEEMVGHTFSGWTQELPTHMVAMDLEITAEYTPNVHTLYFLDLDDNILKEVELQYGEPIFDVPLPEAPVVEGLHFVEWVSPEYLWFMPNEDVYLYPEYSSIPYTGDQYLVWNVPNYPYTLDPGTNGSSDGGDIINHLYEGLVREVNGEIMPGVAESWEVSSDGLTVTFHRGVLHQGCKNTKNSVYKL